MGFIVWTNSYLEYKLITCLSSSVIYECFIIIKSYWDNIRNYVRVTSTLNPSSEKILQRFSKRKKKSNHEWLKSRGLKENPIGISKEWRRRSKFSYRKKFRKACRALRGVFYFYHVIKWLLVLRLLQLPWGNIWCVQ